ncbi:MAG: hypothetical protein N2508_10125 [Anaerolineae bacterium]|nr:hypothetical protein [Anaerolineae bacterium]
MKLPSHSSARFIYMNWLGFLDRMFLDRRIDRCYLQPKLGPRPPHDRPVPDRLAVEVRHDLAGALHWM